MALKYYSKRKLKKLSKQIHCSIRKTERKFLINVSEMETIPNFIDYIKWKNWFEYVGGSNGTNNNS